jgi:hypothetical protein
MEERKAVADAISDWNSSFTASKNIVLQPIRWETDTTPSQGRPQDVIDKQLKPQDCDFLIGILWSTLGTITVEGVTGTVHEIESFRETKKPLMVYFSQKPMTPNDLGNGKQYEELCQFRESFLDDNMICKFNSPEELRRLVYKHISEYFFREGEIYNEAKLNLHKLGISGSCSLSGLVSLASFDSCFMENQNDFKRNIFPVIEFPKFISSTIDNSYKTYSSRNIQSKIGSFSALVFIDSKGKGIRRDGNHYIVSHNTTEGRPIKLNDKRGYPNVFAIGYVEEKWSLYLSNNDINLNIFPHKHQDDIPNGWHLFVLRWNRKIEKLEFIIDEDTTEINEFNKYWPEKYSDEIYIGTWPNKHFSHYTEADIAHVYFYNKWVDDEILLNEYNICLEMNNRSHNL